MRYMTRYMKRRLVILIRSELGVSSIEYALLGALIVVVIVGAVGLLGGRVHAMYQNIRDSVIQALN